MKNLEWPLILLIVFLAMYGPDVLRDHDKAMLERARIEHGCTATAQ